MLIRSAVLEGKDYIQIQQEMGIPEGTWDAWVYRNQHGFRELLISWKKERMVKKAEKRLESLVYAEDERVSLNASTFVLETLAKDEGYTKRIENTGKDGKDLIPQPILGNDLQTDDSDKENSEAKETDQSNPGGNIGQQDNLDTLVIDQPSATEGQDTGTDLNSVGELSTPETRSNEGLSLDNGNAPILQGQPLE